MTATQRILRIVDGKPAVMVPYPDRIAAQLAAQYGALNTRALELVDRYLVPAIASGSKPRMKSAIAQIERTLAAEYSDKKVAAMATAAGKQANGYNSTLFLGALGVAIGAKILAPSSKAPLVVKARGKVIPLRPRPGATLTIRTQVDPALWSTDFVAENVALISDLRRGIVPGLEDTVIRAVDRGKDPSELAAELRQLWKRHGIPSTLESGEGRTMSLEAHSQLVAEDQINKLNARLSQERQLAAGIDSFRWRTRGDDRVRQRHRELDGTVWTWESGGPPGVGLPGHPVRCRCSAEAVIDRAQVWAALDLAA